MPLLARAQQAATPVIGFLGAGSETGFAPHLATFRKALAEAGFVEGQNVTILVRWANDRYERLPGLAAELVRHPATIIVTAGGTQTALAAKAASATTPIIFLIGSDPVRLGLVASLNRPGGNLTGLTILTVLLGRKRLELMRELLPDAMVFAWLSNPGNPAANMLRADIEAAAQTLQRRVIFLNAATEAELESVFASAKEQRAGALVVTADPFFTNHRTKLIALAQRYALPTMYPNREHVADGGLISYGANSIASYSDIADYTARVLRGARPGELPVLQPTKFELAISLRAAKAIGIKVPTSILLRADEVIE